MGERKKFTRLFSCTARMQDLIHQWFYRSNELLTHHSVLFTEQRKREREFIKIVPKKIKESVYLSFHKWSHTLCRSVHIWLLCIYTNSVSFVRVALMYLQHKLNDKMICSIAYSRLMLCNNNESKLNYCKRRIESM